VDAIARHVISGFERAVGARSGERRIGAELKFPFVDAGGAAASYEDVRALWRYLERRGWRPKVDAYSGEVTGATLPGPMNETLASCETGFCKVEFSLAHVADLHELAAMLAELTALLRDFSGETGRLFLGCGIHPVTPPGRHLLMKKGRNLFWDKIFGSNRRIAPEDGDDVHLFTVSASSQVHVDVTPEEAVRAVNVFNGFAGAQVALTANSNVWKGDLDPEARCVGELFWDWWIPGTDRYGVPPRPFASLEDYVGAVARLRPVYVKRDGLPVGLPGYGSFAEYYAAGAAAGVDAEGRPVALVPEPADIDQHGTFYWYNARISRYQTLENRVNDQQPPGELGCVAALTAGVAAALDEAAEEIAAHPWEALRASREVACREALGGAVDGLALRDLAGRLLDVAELGLRRRSLGEGELLAPLRARLAAGRCPADEAAELFRSGGVAALVAARRI